ncbi:MAG: hypothetical protein ACPLRM_09775, partial [Anaerolineae bacterium]
RLLKDMVSGPLDADKQDYLLRDSYYCGVRYGIYDLDRLLQTLEAFDDGDERILAITEDGVHALEQFVLAKYYYEYPGLPPQGAPDNRCHARSRHRTGN